jgi:AcrR family transcriptional regulator
VKGRLSRTEQRARTRADLVDAAERVFAERGFQAASVEAIATAAGYTRGAFYSNFESKEELFAELLQQRVYARYREMAERSAGAEPPTLREVGEQLAAIQDEPAGGPLFRLWLELLAHAGRDDAFRMSAREFWRGTRAGSSAALDAAFASAGERPPVPTHLLATAMIALDIGLAIQHFVDPDEVPLSAYPELYTLLFGPHAP